MEVGFTLIPDMEVHVSYSLLVIVFGLRGQIVSYHDEWSVIVDILEC
jgi:hypothetical protein